MLMRKLNSYIALILSLFVFCFCQNVNANEENVPPVELPFFSNKVGDVYAFDVNVVEPLTYSIQLRFYLKLPNKWSHFFDNESPEDSRRIYEILGGPKNIAVGEWVEAGIPAKFRVQIIQKVDGKMILDDSISRPKTSAAYMGRYAVLANKYLPKGMYTIRVEYLEGRPELAPLYAKILFARAHHGK